MNQKPEIYENKEKWLANRSLGASSICALMSEKNSFVSKNDLYNDLVFGKKSTKSNSKMLKGIEAEANLRNLFAIDYSQYKVIEPPQNGSYWVYRRKLQDDIDFTTTPDGILEGQEGFGGLEIKYVDVCSAKEIEEWNLQVPIKYFWQCMGYFVAMPELNFVILYAHIKHYTYDGKEFSISHSENKAYYFSRDVYREDIEKAEKAIVEFYTENVKPRKRPAAVISI